MPGARAGEGFFVAGRLHPKMGGAGLDILPDQGMDVVGAGPFQPIAVRDLEVDVDHAVDERGGHGLDDGAVLSTIARADYDRPFGQMIFADAAFVNEAVESLLDFVRAGVEFVEEKAI